MAKLTNDNQMNQDVELMRRYQQTLADALWQTEHRAPQLTVEEVPSTPEAPQPDRGNTASKIPPTPDKIAPAPAVPSSRLFIGSLLGVGLIFGLIGIFVSEARNFS